MPTGPTQPAKPASVDAAPADARIGKFVRLEKLGRGGMGEVWKAWDTELNRFVALKFLLADDPDEIARFKREAQTAGRLNHPNIAAIYEVGQSGASHFIAMQYVQGGTLKTVPRNDRREVVRMIRDAALALHHAHRQGIIHRDLKPENLMVEQGRVYVMDFGLARQVQAAHSTSGLAVGTPAYMPPEQARGQRADERSDVYGLGAALYELLTDRAPFHAGDVYSLLIKVIDDEPRPPRAINPALDREIETIVLKCLEKDPARRYASAAALAADLDRWLKGEAIDAHPPSAFYRLRKSMAKRKAILAVSVAGLALAGLVAGITIPKWLAKERELAALKELGALWTEIVLAKQGYYRSSADPARVRAKMADSVNRVSEFIAKDPGRPQGYYVRARGRLYLNDLAAAEADLRTAIRLDPSFAPGEALLGRVLMQQHGLLLYGTPRTAAARIAAARPLLEEARVHLSKGWTDGAQRRSIETWGLVKTREDEVAEAVIPALLAVYAQDRKDEGIRLLTEAHARERSEEYANWLGLWSTDIRDVIRWQSEALALMPLYAKALLDRGVAHSLNGDLDKAVADFLKTIEVEPRNPIAYANLAAAHFHLGDHDAELADWTRAIDLEPRNAFFRVERAHVKLRAHDAAGALADCETALSIDPRLALALDARGRARGWKGDPDGALVDFAAAIALDPTDGSAYAGRGFIRGNRGDTAGELEDYNRAIELDPKCAEAYANRSAVHLKKGEFAEAFDDASKAIEFNPRSADAYVNRATARGARGDLDGVLRDAAAAIEIDPGKSEAYSTRASALGIKGDWDGAMTAAQKAIDLDARNAAAYGARGGVRLERGNVEGAIEDATAAIGIERRADWYFLRGLAKERKNDLNGAIADWTSGLEISPRHAKCLHNRGIVRMRKGDLEGAIDDETKAIEADPRNAVAYYQRGLAHAQKRELKPAIEDYTKAVAINPSYAEAYANRGGLYGMLGENALAEVDFSKALEVAPANWSYRRKVEEMLRAVRK